MKQRLFFDSDILIDLVCQRKPFSMAASQLIGQCENRLYIGTTSTLALANCYYIFERFSHTRKAKQQVAKLRELLTVLPVNDKELGESLSAGFKDFEDGIQYFVAINHNCDFFITRNIKDYKLANIPVLTAEQFLAH